jgi:ATP-dependent helicase/nuclease subunit B
MKSCDIDLLENYCLAFGITGSDWQSNKQWNFAGADDKDFNEQQINRIRLETVSPLLELQDRLCPVGNSAGMLTADEFTLAVFHFLDELKVKETIGGWIEEAGSGDNSAADKHQQFYNKFVDIFDELTEIFTGQSMKAEDYFAIINSAFSQLTLAFIPPTLDQVLVGSIERSRHPDLRAAFLIGATQRQFPVPVSSGSILTDDDRITAESADFQLAPASSQTLAERQYLAYIAFTRPSEFLCITYPSVDDKGGELPRSQFVGDLESLFENLCEESIAGDQVDLEKIYNETELSDLLCSRLGRDAFEYKADDKSHLEGLLNDICSDQKFAGLGQNVVSAIDYDNNAQLDEDLFKELFGRQIQSSATKLSTFAECPYRYFARYILELEKRKEFKIEPLDLGLFYHSVLDALLKKLNEQGKDFVTIDGEELLNILHEQVKIVIQASPFLINFSKHSPHNAYIINSAVGNIQDCVLAISQMAGAGSFRPKFSEVSFGRLKEETATIGKYELALSDDRILSLNGKIDRLDIADIEDEKVGLIFDYKRRGTSFDWSKFYYGINMQLPIYMLAVRNTPASKVKSVAGAFYMPVEVSLKTTTLGELPKENDSFNYKAKGIFNGRYAEQLDGGANSGWSRYYNFRISSRDEQYGHYKKSGALRPDDFEKVLKFTEDKIIQIAENIVAGEIDVRPYRLKGQSPCSYCEYKSICRFDWQINDYNFLATLGKSEVLEKIGEVNG